MMDLNQYSTGDRSFQAAGGTPGLRQLVDDFYDAMDTISEAAKIRRMHPEDLTVSRDKLARFLSGWLNGPNTFRPKYGPIHIPRAHHHLSIGEAEMEAWLQCMNIALEKQPYEAAFKTYMLRQLRIPAERCRTH
jgi:hemoglobin